MSLLGRLFGTHGAGNEDGESDAPEERPPKPDPKHSTYTETFPFCEITVGYRTGETETLRTHSYGFGDRVLSIGTGNPSYFYDGVVGPWMVDTTTVLENRQGSILQEYPDSVSIPYEVLATRPRIQQIGETVVEYERTAHYRYRDGDWIIGDREYELGDIETTLDSDTDQDQDQEEAGE